MSPTWKACFAAGCVAVAVVICHHSRFAFASFALCVRLMRKDYRLVRQDSIGNPKILARFPKKMRFANENAGKRFLDFASAIPQTGQNPGYIRRGLVDCLFVLVRLAGVQ